MERAPQPYNPRYDQPVDDAFSFGQIAYRGFREIMRTAPPWFELDRMTRAAWEVSALNIIESVNGKREIRVIHPRKRKPSPH